MLATILPASFTTLIAGLKFWKEKQSLTEQQAKYRDEAINVVLKASLLTKSYLYDCRELNLEQDRSREENLSQVWQQAANSIRLFDRKLYQSAQIKALGWADHREWLKAEEKNIEVKLDALIEQCEWQKEQKT
ncbi:hypothetical protein [Aeromonas caviae]|uniref:hypothetical protein n=1 Tax=Aeromonas caviae TaxID=648 RepID=UPI002B48094E|nr:hypothetical protein [Aeromonas caviae]